MASIGEDSSVSDKVEDKCHDAAWQVETTSSVKSSTVDDPSCIAADSNPSYHPSDHPDSTSCSTEADALIYPDSIKHCPETESQCLGESIGSENVLQQGDLKGDTYSQSSSTCSQAQPEESKGMGQLTSCIGGHNLTNVPTTAPYGRDYAVDVKNGKKGGKDKRRLHGSPAKDSTIGNYKAGPVQEKEKQFQPEREEIAQASVHHGRVNKVQINDLDEKPLEQNVSDQEEDIYRSKATIDILAIGERKELVDYSCEEWKGSTSKTKRIKKAYLELSNKGYYDIRRVRGDNYCGLRATLFQAFWKKIKILQCFPKNLTEVVYQLNKENKELIENWAFANREVKNRRNQESLVICLQNLQNEWLKAESHVSTQADAETFCKDLFNHLGVTEWRLYEAVKLLMLWKALELYSMQKHGQDVPLFASLMFARETSLNPLSFLRNHLNHVGSSGGLEQVEMCLLGYALGITIRVFRLYMIDTEEFEVCYPEQEPQNGGATASQFRSQEVAIVTEDDRHYNVLLPSPDKAQHVHSKERARSPHAL